MKESEPPTGTTYHELCGNTLCVPRMHISSHVRYRPLDSESTQFVYARL
jgi:hypothetical protein